MDKFIELLIFGISQGFIYSLIAMGFALIFKASDVVNFAHGSLLLFGAFIVAQFRDHGFWLALTLGLLAAAALGLVIERFLVRAVRSRDVNALFLMTIGLDIILTTELVRQIGPSVLSVGGPWGSATVQVGPAHLPLARVIVVVLALTLMIGFFLAFRYSTWGVSMRAAAEDPEAATLVGINMGRSSASAWCVASILATIAGVFLFSFPSPGLESTSGLGALRAFPAVIIGGLDSIGGAVLGGLIVGIAETMVSGYQNDLLFLGRGIGEVVPYLIMVAVLVRRPAGLFGTREVARV